MTAKAKLVNLRSPKSQQMDFFDRGTRASLTLPDNLTFENWIECGRVLATAHAGVQWWLGDWWLYGLDREWGKGQEIADEVGTNYGTLRNYGAVARAYELSCRNDNLTHKHHFVAMAVEGTRERLRWLKRAEKEGWSAAQLKAEIARTLAITAGVNAEWTQEQLERRTQAENGLCVVANMHEEIDPALIAWADSNDRLVRIDRQTEWGNPFEIPDDGERADVIGKFSKFYLPHKTGLLAKIPSLRGKVITCWCHPKECHGHIIAEIVNREACGEGTAEALADQIAGVDG